MIQGGSIEEDYHPTEASKLVLTKKLFYLEVMPAEIVTPTTPPSSSEKAKKNAIIEASFAVIGAISFVVGSIGFIRSTWMNDSWLLPFQLGCGIWIFGCFCFLISIGVTRYQRLLLLSKQQQQQNFDDDDETTTPATMTRFSGSSSCCFFHYLFGSRWSVSEICQSACQLLFLLGCFLAFGTEHKVLENLAIINGAFLCGSLVLVVDVMHTLLLLLRTKKHSSTTNNNRRKSFGSSDESSVSSSSSSSSSSDTEAADLMALVLNGIIALCFVYAAVLGGYGKSADIIRAGMPGWTIGSMASGVSPIRQLHDIFMVGGGGGGGGATTDTEASSDSIEEEEDGSEISV